MRRPKVEIYSYKGGRTPVQGKILLSVVLLFVLTFGGAFGFVLAGSHSQIENEANVMVILGCQVKPWGPSVLLQNRLDTALDYLQSHPDMLIVVTGGKGDDEHLSEAAAMYQYLTEHGVAEEQILLEDQAENTLENLKYTKVLLSEEGIDTTQEILVVSNEFHLARTRMLFARVWGNDENLNTLAAPSTHWPSKLKMHVREPLALIKSAVFDR